MTAISRFANKYRKHLFHLLAEEVFGAMLRGVPSLPGLWLRWGLYRCLFKRVASFPIIYPGVYLTHSYGISVGRGCSINTGALLDGRGGIRVGDDVMIGPYVVIASSSHDHRNTSRPMNAFDHVMAPVVVGNNVWIGAHAFIRGGVTIGNGCVVGAGAVVLTDVPDDAIVGGVPARQIGSRAPVNDRSAAGAVPAASA